MIRINSNAGETPLDPNEINGLLLPHISTREELDRWEMENILEALEWLEKNSPKAILNAGFIKELHRRMFCNIWKWAGKFRQSDKTIGEAWYQIPMLIDNLFKDTKYWIIQKKNTNDEIAVYFHHRLVLIHPFTNGNGRHARLMTDLLLENILKAERFTWGSKIDINNKDARKIYIDSLREADNLNFGPLLEFVRS